MTSDADLVLRERRGAVEILTWNRPDRLNAWSTALEDRYFDLLEQADADPDVRAIVVTGAGRAFCAGADLDDLQAAPDATDASIDRPRPRSYPMAIRKPVIGAVNGAAAGLGLVEALYCDLRFASPSALFLSAFVRRGLIAEYGSTWLLSRLVGPSAAFDILVSGRKIAGEEAHRMGLVDRLVSEETLLDEAVAYADDLATWCAPTSMAIIKRQLQVDADGDFAGAEATADRLMRTSFKRADLVEGVQSFAERRPPAFAPLPDEVPDLRDLPGRS